MDLLNANQYEKTKEKKGKKFIIILLILSIIALIGVIILMVYISSTIEPQVTLYINDAQQKFETDFIISDNQGVEYIELKALSNFLGYEYYNGEYNSYSEDTMKCYIKNKKLISGFEQDSNIIYKYEEETNLDYQYYELNYNIILRNDKLYIAMADLIVGLNVNCDINEKKEVKISTMDYLAQVYQQSLRDKGYTVVTDPNNQKAISYGWIIVNRNGLYSVLDTSFNEIIGAKYTSIYFDEKNLNYIVANSNGQYGVITNSGITEQSLKYDGLEVLNYENMLYKVKNNDKYGIMQANGTMLTEIIYDEIGYKPEPENKILYTLIIPEVDGKSGKLIVVKQNGKYGLITLEQGESFLPCDHVEKLYSVRDLEKVEYKIEAERQTMDLLEYLKLRGTEIVQLN